MTQFAVKDIRPNPFRNMKCYPIRKDKVIALRESLKTTGFWGNVVARLVDGHPEIAYGHHRLVALREEYGPSEKVDLIIRKLDDKTMLQMMARENMEEWGTSAVVELETVRAVVEAYGKGLIELPAVSKDTGARHIRYAPNFVPGEEDVPPARVERSYTAESIAEFIGWVKPGDGDPQKKVYNALAALQYIEEEILTEDDFEGLSTKQAEAVVAEARKAREVRESRAKKAGREAAQAEKEAAAAESASERKEAQERAAEARQEEKKQKREGREKAKAVAKKVGRAMKGGKAGYRQAAQEASKADKDRYKKNRPPPHLDAIAERLAADMHKLFESNAIRVQKLEVCIEYAAVLSNRARKELIHALEKLSTRASSFAGKLNVNGAKRALTEGR